MVRLAVMANDVSNYRHCKSFFVRHALGVSEILFYTLWALRHEEMASMVFEEENEDDQIACVQVRKVFLASQEVEIDGHRMENHREVFLLED